MDLIEFQTLAKSLRIRPQVDIDGPLQDGVEALFEQIHNKSILIHFVPSSDPKVLNITGFMSFLGESLMDAIVAIENNYPVAFTITEREDVGVNVSLEYYPRILTFEEAIRYRRAHSKPGVSDTVHS